MEGCCLSTLQSEFYLRRVFAQLHFSITVPDGLFQPTKALLQRCSYPHRLSYFERLRCVAPDCSRLTLNNTGLSAAAWEDMLRSARLPSLVSFTASGHIPVRPLLRFLGNCHRVVSVNIEKGSIPGDVRQVRPPVLSKLKSLTAPAPYVMAMLSRGRHGLPSLTKLGIDFTNSLEEDLSILNTILMKLPRHVRQLGIMLPLMENPLGEIADVLDGAGCNSFYIKTLRIQCACPNAKRHWCAYNDVGTFKEAFSRLVQHFPIAQQAGLGEGTTHRADIPKLAIIEQLQAEHDMTVTDEWMLVDWFA